MAFKYVPGYWAFRALFKWRAELELRLDALHDATAQAAFQAAVSVEEDLARHVSWTEAKRGVAAPPEEAADLRQMLALRGMISAPKYEKPASSLPVSRAGGGRKKRKTMRATSAAEYAACDDPPRKRSRAGRGQLAPTKVWQLRHQRAMAGVSA